MILGYDGLSLRHRLFCAAEDAGCFRNSAPGGRCSEGTMIASDRQVLAPYRQTQNFVAMRYTESPHF